MDTQEGAAMLKHICTLKLSIAVNVDNYGVKQLTKENLKRGKPSIKQDVTTGVYYLELHGADGGHFCKPSSDALNSISKSKAGTFTAMVGLDAAKVNHSLIIINILAPLNNSFIIITNIILHLKNEFSKFVTVPPDIALLPGVRSAIEKNLKRPLHQTNQNIATITVEAPSKIPKTVLHSPITTTNATTSVTTLPATSQLSATPQVSATSSATSSPTSLVFGNIEIKKEKTDIPYKPLYSNNALLAHSNNLLSSQMSTNSTISTSPPTPSVSDVLRRLMQSSSSSSSQSPLLGLPNTTFDEEPTNIADLPTNILAKLHVFNNAGSSSGRERNDAGSLLNEGSSTGRTCGFLLGRVELPASSETSDAVTTPADPDTDSSDDDVNFSSRFINRRRRRRVDPTAHIGADSSELYEDPADSNLRNFGLLPQGPDSADVMFQNTPEPVVQKDELDEFFDLMSELPKNILAEPCSAIRQSMLPHQKMALHWMIERENTKELPPFWECVTLGRDYVNIATRQRVFEKPLSVNGGILADDMGLGKTLTAIALILTNHINAKPMFDGGFRKKKLPMNAQEIHEMDEDLPSAAIKSSSIMIKTKKEGYIKPKTTTKTEFNKPGFQFRQLYKQQMGSKKKKKKKIKEETTSDNLFSDSDDEKDVKKINKHVSQIIHSPIASSISSPDSSNHAAPMKRVMFGQQATDRKSTLIVCPMSVLSNWTTQFQQHLDPTIDLQIYVFYGPERVRDLTFLNKHDVIITTYGTVTSDFKAIESKGKVSPLHKINWLRVILDEGHIIRNARSQQTIAMMAINSSRRWLLTGTPIQNRMTDLWSIVKFLRLEPFTNRKWWFKYVVESMKRKPKPGELVYNRVQKIIKHMAIRRLKTDQINGEPLVKLPERRVVIQKIKFSDDERKLYDAMQKDGKLIICKYFRMNAVLKNYANVLAIIMRLRQLCCHPNLCLKAVKKLQQAMEMMDQLRDQLQGGNEDEVDDNDVEEQCDISDVEREKLIEQLMQLLSSGDSEECSICLENLEEPVITRCAHVFCSNCINEVIENAEIVATCPLCRADIDLATMVKVPQVSKTVIDEEENGKKKKVIDDDEPWISSAKVDAVMEALVLQRKKDPHMKSLVVSQFTSFLDVVQRPLKEEGFHFVRLDGTMSQGHRTRVIDEFQNEDDYSPTVMLLSLTAGGVGLNLIAASRVFLLDPAWNPAIEEQCFDRCHRLGQTKDVLIIKFIVEDTVEDRMLILQKQKRQLMERAFGITQASPEERRAATLRDIGTLLGIDFRAGRNPPPPTNNNIPAARPVSPGGLPVIALGGGNRPAASNRPTASNRMSVDI